MNYQRVALACEGLERANHSHEVSFLKPSRQDTAGLGDGRPLVLSRLVGSGLPCRLMALAAHKNLENVDKPHFSLSSARASRFFVLTCPLTAQRIGRWVSMLVL